MQSTYHWTGNESCWWQPSEGTVSRFVLFLPLNDRSRVVKSGSHRCLSQAAIKCWPLLLGTHKKTSTKLGMNISLVEINPKIKSYSLSRISIWHIFTLISSRAVLIAASLCTRASSSTNLKLNHVIQMNYINKANTG